MAQVDAFDGAGDVNELAGAQRPTAADIDQPRFTKDMTVRWLCSLANGTLKSAGCKSADKVGFLKARLKSLLGVAEDDDADLGGELSPEASPTKTGQGVNHMNRFPGISEVLSRHKQCNGSGSGSARRHRNRAREPASA